MSGVGLVGLEARDLAGAAALLGAIDRELGGIVTTTGHGDWFLFYDPDGITVPEQRFPFCTLVTGDRYDAASRLDRDPATYRVNLGVDRETTRGSSGRPRGSPPAPRCSTPAATTRSRTR